MFITYCNVAHFFKILIILVMASGKSIGEFLIKNTTASKNHTKENLQTQST